MSNTKLHPVREASGGVVHDIENIVGSIAEIAAVHDSGAAGSTGAAAAAIPAHLRDIFERVKNMR